MKNQFSLLPKFAVMALLLLPAFVITNTAHAQQHPHYLHALEDLRAAQYMIQHRENDWHQLGYENVALGKIQEAFRAIKEAAVEDHKDIFAHETLDTNPERLGRLHKALDYLKKAHEDVSKEEENSGARGLRNRAIIAIDAAADFVQKAIATKME